MKDIEFTLNGGKTWMSLRPQDLQMRIIAPTLVQLPQVEFRHKNKRN